MKNLRKAAQMIGMDYDVYNEMVITDKIRKCRFYIGWDNGYTDIQKKVLKLCKDWKIQHMTILRPHRLIGEYGRVTYNTIKVGDVKTYFEYNPKKIHKALRELYNIHNENKFYWVETSDGLWHLYYIPDGYSTYHYGENDSDELIIMSNGQVFDIGNQHYFSIQDSRVLLKEIKKGYDYYDPQYFYTDCYPETSGVGFYEE